MAIRERKRNKGDTPSLEMTPMIDVVFQLLIFFIVAIKEEDILARLNAARPAPSKTPPESEPLFIDIEIGRHTVLYMKQQLAANLMLENPDYSVLDKGLAYQARFNKNATVTIRCTADSPHGALVKVLDLCEKYKLNQVNIFSM